MLVSNVPHRRAGPIDRSADRQIVLLAIVAAVGFLAASLAVIVLPIDTRRGLWLPLHLALAGGATTAIVGVMPFFVAAFAAAPPADVRLRTASLLLVIAGAVALPVGVLAAPVLAVAGGVAFVAGILLAGLATLRPLSGALGPSRGLVTQAYLLALAMVAVGATVATLFVAGWPPALESWASLRPAHAWLNLVGFVSLVIATTLLHFFPTVMGTRIGARQSGRVAVGGLASGAVLVASGFLLGLDLLVRAGSLATIGGSWALAVYGVRVWSTRAAWTSDPGWHRFAAGGLASAIGWFVVGIAIAGGRGLVLGASPSGWSLEPLAVPLVIGWVGLAILASATHLVPAVGPGDPAAHARQRAILGIGASARLVSLDVGIAAMTAGQLVDVGPFLTIGGLLVIVGFGLTAILIAAAVTVGWQVRQRRADDRPDRAT